MLFRSADRYARLFFSFLATDMWGPHVSTDSHVTLPSPSSPNCARKISGGDRRRPHQSRPLWPRSPSSFMPIKRPRRPLSVPPHPSPFHASRPPHSIAGVRPVTAVFFDFPVSSRIPELSHSLHPLPILAAHLSDLLPCVLDPQNEPANDDATPPSCRRCSGEESRPVKTPSPYSDQLNSSALSPSTPRYRHPLHSLPFLVSGHGAAVP